MPLPFYSKSNNKIPNAIWESPSRVSPGGVGVVVGYLCQIEWDDPEDAEFVRVDPHVAFWIGKALMPFLYCNSNLGSWSLSVSIKE